MSEKIEYSVESFVDVNPLEHIRIRPAMYIGRVDEKGNLEIIKGLFEYFEQHVIWNEVNFINMSNDLFKITFNGVLNYELERRLFDATLFSTSDSNYLFQVIVALSEKCIIESNGKELCFEKEAFVSERNIENTASTSITFGFDAAILKSKELPDYLLFNYFKRYVCIYPEKEILIYKNDKKIANFTSNGLSDWFAMKSFENELLMKPFQFFIEDETIDLKAEIMFSLYDEKEAFSTITLPRADFVKQNGTHTKGFLKGLHCAVKEVLGEIGASAFTDYGNLIGIFKLSYPTIMFYGPTRNEVGSEELVEVFEKGTQEALLANDSFKETILELFGS
ncbi:MAG: hypothetical protein AB8B65_08645 [Kordia sp.]|uniref:hypothetical protein n=1 Tax=Kordia sp. TaxID=1965332 RepID=UPI00385CB3ED